jgi:hypothetical protein
MTQDEIIEMARQAGFTQPEGETWYEAFPQCIEVFAKLVAGNAFKDGYEKGIAAFNEAVLIEREACAKVCEEHLDGLSMIGGAFVTCASAIRARGENT